MRGHGIGYWRRGDGGYNKMKMKGEGFKFEKYSKAEGERREREKMGD